MNRLLVDMNRLLDAILDGTASDVQGTIRRLLDPIQDATASDVRELQSRLSGLARQYAFSQGDVAHAMYDLVVMLERCVSSYLSLRWATELHEYRQLPPYSDDRCVECPTCFHVHLDQRCPNGCESTSFSWKLSIAPADIMLLCDNGRIEAATIVAASYYEGSLFSLFSKVLKVHCADHLADKLDLDARKSEMSDEQYRADCEVADRDRDDCEKCGRLHSRRRKRKIVDLYSEHSDGVGSSRRKYKTQGAREDTGCKDVFGDKLLAIIERLPLDGVSEFDALREDIMDRRHLYVHRGLFHASALLHKTQESYQLLGQTVRFVRLCWDVFRELQNEHIAKVAIRRLESANNLREDRRIKGQ